MNLRKTIRKVAAVGAGLTMVGATLMGAMAANLNEYPSPFVKDGVFDAVLIVGDGAAAADVVGVTDIAMALQYGMGVEVAVEGESVTVTGGEEKEVELDAADLTDDFAETLSDSKIDSLADDQLTWNDETIDYEEIIDVNGFKMLTSIDDADLDSVVYLGTDGTETDTEIYWKTTDADMDVSEVSTTEELKITLFGKSLTITSMNATLDSITAQLGESIVLGVGDSYDYDGNIITVTSIGDGTIAVDVDGEVEFLDADESEDFGDVTVEVENILYTDDVESREVLLEVGADTTKTVTDGESLEFFGEPEDEDDAEWLWHLEIGDAAVQIGAQYNFQIEDENDPLVGVGEKINFPNDFGYIEFESLNVVADLKITGEFDDVTVIRNETDATIDVDYDYALVLKSDSAGEGFKVNVSGTWEDTDEVYLIDDSDTWAGAFENSDGKIQLFMNGSTDAAVGEGAEVYIINDETTINIGLANISASNLITFADFEDATEDLVIHADIDGLKLGATQEDADAEDLNLTSSTAGMGTADESYRTIWGNIIEEPENNADADEFILHITPEQMLANIVVAGPETVVSSSSTTTTEYEQIEVGATKLASEVDVFASNAIVVGGPCINAAAADLMDNPEVCGEGFVLGEAMIKLFENEGKVAMLVAGYEAEDTRTACKLVAGGSLADIDGMEAVVVSASETVTGVKQI